jgi:hypothetical protein
VRLWGQGDGKEEQWEERAVGRNRNQHDHMTLGFKWTCE